MESVLRDVRFALKLLVRDRAFSLTVLLTLGVCIATHVATYSVVRSVILDPLPFDEPHELVTLYNSYPGAGGERSANGVPDYFMRRDRIDALEEVAAYRGSGVAVGGEMGAEQVDALRVTPSLFPLLGVQAASGRIFLEEEMEPDAAPTLLVTHAYWEEVLGSDPDAVGSTVRANAVPTTIVGILPEDFRMPGQPDLRLVLPLQFSAEERSLERWHSNSLQMLGRLAPNATLVQVQAQIDALNASLTEEAPIPDLAQLLEDVGFRTVVVDTRADLTRDVRSVLFLLWGGAAFVLLIGCVNIANLMLARAETRARELATRMSLGAQRLRLARQVLTEAAVTGILGAVLGTALGAVGLRLLTAYGIDELPRGSEVGLDGPVLLYTLGVALTAALAFGAVPVVHLLRSELASVFREEGRGGTSSRATVHFRNGLVAGQIGLAFLLLVSAGLMFRSFHAALDVDPGFEAEGVLTAYLSLPSARYPDGEAQRAFVRELLAATRALPGVAAAGITTQLPFGFATSSSVTFPEGYVPRPGESIIAPRYSVAGPGYFEALGIDLLQGRTFQETDGPDAARVVVIDQWLAERFWPNDDALGERLVVGAVPGTEEAADEANLYTVIGIVEDLKFQDLTQENADYVGAYYLTHSQNPADYFSLALRSQGSPQALIEPLRSAVARLDAELPLFGVLSMEDRVAGSLTDQRTAMTILLALAGVALVLAVVGIYGVLTYAVARRTREIGIRMAVGGAPASVFTLILKQGLVLIGSGLLLGAAGVLVLMRFIGSVLYGVLPADPLVLAVTAILLAGAAVLACAVPARRATRVDPARSLVAG